MQLTTVDTRSMHLHITPGHDSLLNANARYEYWRLINVCGTLCNKLILWRMTPVSANKRLLLGELSRENMSVIASYDQLIVDVLCVITVCLHYLSKMKNTFIVNFLNSRKI